MKRPKILAVSLALAAAAVCVAAVLYFRSGTHPAGAREGLVVYIGTYGNHLYRYIFDASDGGWDRRKSATRHISHSERRT